MRERLVAWAGDCRVLGDVDMGEGRLSDEVNERDLLTFFDATLEALEDGREVTVDEVEVERREIHLFEVEGHRGDPVRRLRTIEEPVYLEIGPFVVTGNLHRPPHSPALAALQRRGRFLPMTGVQIQVLQGARPTIVREVILVNRDLITKSEPLAAVPIWADEPKDPSMTADTSAADGGSAG